MCGIAGIVSSDPAHLDRIEFLRPAILRRGPNGTGTCRGAGFALTHTRLSILDLTDNAAQPMWSADRRLCLSYNGEVYNYVELREELAITGETFRTTSDTEVLLAALRVWGPDALRRLNGMFAFGAWNPERRELMLARDRLGKKPLYYCRSLDGRGFAFASDLRALIRLGWHHFRFDEHALAHYFAFGHTPAGRSILENVKKLPRGSFMRVIHDAVAGRVQIVPPAVYWDPGEALSNGVFSSSSSSSSDDDDDEELAYLIEDATRVRLRSDVPVALFLSGGVDSSIIASVAAAQTQQSVEAFTAQALSAELDESQHAIKLARTLRIECHAIPIRCNGAQSVETVAAAYDEPFADESAYPLVILSREVSQTHRVVLSGDGGDEAFGGYEKYWNFLSYVRWHRRIRSVLPVGLVSKIASKYHMLMPGYGRISRLQWNAHGAYAASMSTFDPKELAWLRPEVGPGFYPTIAGERARRDREVGLRGMQILDLEGCLPEQILVKLDRATMHHGVEARCPLLDHRIVEYALRLPPPVSPKAPLVGYCRSTAARHALARPKMGFSMPLSTWLLGDLRHLVDDMMHDDGFLEIVRVDGRALRSLVHAHRLGIRKLGRKVWTVLLLWAWRQAIRPYEKFSA